MYIGLHEKKSGNLVHHWEKNMRITRVPLFSDETIKQIKLLARHFKFKNVFVALSLK